MAHGYHRQEEARQFEESDETSLPEPRHSMLDAQNPLPRSEVASGGPIVFLLHTNLSSQS